MKPLSLEFTAFGSYPGRESVDFESLTELRLYVVTGPTGSGKTTIFDAMAYALYGEVPGARDKGDVRSQHADAAATCSVVLRFAVDDVVYRVERTPEQFRPRLRGDGDPVKISPTAVLVREQDDIAIASQPKKVTAACIDLVGLDAEQFERVVLLPQGQFQEFLLANTATRLPLLRQLFGTGKWLTVVEELKDRAVEAKKVIAAIEEQLRQHQFAISGALDAAEQLLPEDVSDVDGSEDSVEHESLDLLAARLQRVEERISPLQQEQRRLTQVADTALAAHTEALSVIDAWDRRVVLLEERQGLDAAAGRVEERRTRRDGARRAEPVLSAVANERRDSAEVERARTSLADSIAALGDASIAAGIGDRRDPDTAADALVAARSNTEARRRSLADLGSATATLAHLHEQSQRLDAEREERRLRLEAIAQHLAPLEDDRLALAELAAAEPERRLRMERAQVLLRQRIELAEIGTRIPAAQVAQDDALARQRAAIRAFDDSAAPRLAESLVDGEACPVCGSHDHPDPAPSSGEDRVDSADRDAATTALMDATQEVQRLGDQQADLIAVLADAATRSVEEIEADLRLASEEHGAATRAGTALQAVNTEIEKAVAERTSIAERLGAIDIERAGIEPRITAAEAQRETMRAELGDLAASWDADPTAAMHELDVIAAALGRVESSVATCRTATQAVTTAEATAKASASALAAALSSSAFATVDDARAVALSTDELAQIDADIHAHDTRNNANRTLLDENLKLDLPEHRPDATDLESAARTARSLADDAATALNQITGHLDLARSNLLSAKAIEEGSGDAVERSTSLQSLAKTCDGQGPKRIALETWVLAGELERVAAAANHHLEKMTNGRYRIERSDESGHAGRQSGLDLRILDAHTGASRRPGSLSGGEQFQASLALALGLADVIGHGGNANGRVFEALFVDEGFGSLDPDSLDQAVEALSQIQASGRTVGVITHVEAMKENLPLGIRVERLPDGRGSTLRVRPTR